MPVTIVDYQNLVKDPLTLGLYKNFYRLGGNVIKLFPVVSVGSLTVKGQRWNTLPTHDFRKLNTPGWTPSTGTTEPEEDRLAIFGGEYSLDKVLTESLKQPMLRDPKTMQIDMHTVAMDRGITYNVFNGDISTEPDGFDGLNARITAGRIVAANNIDCMPANTDCLKVLASAANAKTFVDFLDDAIAYTGLADPTQSNTVRGAIFTNLMGRRGIEKAFKLAEYSVQTKDMLGYTWSTYRGLPLVDVGLQRDRATEIISNVVDPGDGGNDSTYVYIVRFAEPDGDVDSPGSDGMTLIQVNGIQNLGPEDYNTYQKWALQWILGLCHVGDDYCVARLHSLRFAAT